MPKTLDIDILSTGVNVDAFGNVIETDLDKLNEIANSYDPKIFKGKIVLGHSTDAAFMSGRVPSDKIPAHGTIEKAYVQGDKLRALVEVADDAVNWIKEKHFTDRSVALYSPSSPYSPKQGEYYIRHLALLGAAPPAIKGLQPLDEILAESYSETADLGIETITMKTEDKDDMKQPEKEANMDGTTPVGTTDEQPNANGAKSPKAVDAKGAQTTGTPGTDPRQAASVDDNEGKNLDQIEANSQPDTEANGEVPEQFKKKADKEPEAEANSQPEETEKVETDSESEETVVAEDEKVEANAEEDEVAEEPVEEAVDSDTEQDPAKFLDENVTTFLTAILTEGEQGYQGEISRFVPEPVEDNGWLTDENGNFAGVFVDESLGEPEEFEFTLTQSGDEWTQSFKPINGEEAPADEPVEEPVVEPEEDVEANMQKPVEANGQDKKIAFEETQENPVVEDEANGQLNSDARVSEPVIDPEVEANGCATCGGMETEAPVATLDPRDKEIAMLKKMLMQKAEDELFRQGEELYSEGILVEGQIAQDDLKNVLSTLNGMPTVIAAFGEEYETPASMLLGLLGKLPKQIAFGEISTSEEKAEIRLPIEEPIGVAFSEKGSKHMREIVAYCEKNELDVKNLQDFRKAMKATAPEE